MKTLVSFTIQSEFGMFKKPDINDKIFVSYNMIHKPYLLGVLGAIMGYGGHNQNEDKSKMPEYYEKLKDIRIAVSPSDKNGGIFKKEFIIFNNTTNGSISNITEQTLVEPAYRIYLELDDENEEHLKLIDSLKNHKAVYPPYMGKNEFSLHWWDIEKEQSTFHKHVKFIKKREFKERFMVKTLIKRDEDFKIKGTGYKERTTNYFYLFERLPIGFDEQLKQYKYHDFLYTNSIFKPNKILDNLYECDEGVICLF
ncbi:MAG: Type I-B CRISPR-associated protein Cas5 [uncultured Sulfurovum sp.]|uniref:Type I-B CRISPR-associated protein Cas5 n=1 Tax=uncultured Sulfurovum sp. TaxID=269237 RepID=A0A6S6TMZ6_9BACT|nr:MAG: Type I-B CRISPR-associated protein Cas5 [uncultured Sulfurovum sp.]